MSGGVTGGLAARLAAFPQERQLVTDLQTLWVGCQPPNTPALSDEVAYNALLAENGDKARALATLSMAAAAPSPPIGGVFTPPAGSPASAAPSPPISGVFTPTYYYYQWQDDHGVWHRFNDSMTRQIIFGNSANVKYGGHTYQIDDVRMTQTNHATGKVRQIRQSSDIVPASVLSSVAAPPGGAGSWATPLFGASAPEECESSDSLFGDEAEQVLSDEMIDFSSVIHEGHVITKWWDAKLPPIACSRTVFQYGACRVDEGSAEWEAVKVCLSGKKPLRGMFRVQNMRLLSKWNEYRAQLEADMATDRSTGKVESLLLFHGCSRPENINSIAHSGFDVIYSSSDSSINAYGSGIYFGSDPSLSEKYACKAPKELRAVADVEGTKIVFLALFSKGDMMRGSRKLVKPQYIEGSRTGRRFDTMCNSVEHPTIFVATDNHQAYPAYILCL